jgi:hypothetical protein
MAIFRTSLVLAGAKVAQSEMPANNPIINIVEAKRFSMMHLSRIQNN